MNKKIDIMVLGATGFTGKFVVKKLGSLSKDTEYYDLKWGIAGRSIAKMQNLLKELQETGVDVSGVQAIQCDITDAESLKKATVKAKVLLNATGPNTELSDPVVRACIYSRTHYLDISAELYHMLNIYRKFNAEAEKAGVLIVSACGFGSVPTLAGLIHLERVMQGPVHSVECYVELELPKRALIPGPGKCLVHHGTWESLVTDFHNYRRYSALKKQTYPESAALPPELNRSFVHKQNGKYWCPYPGPDHDLVEFTQHYWQETNQKQPYHFQIYVTMPHPILFFFLIPLFYVAYYLCYFNCFANLMKTHSKLFSLGLISRKGPTEEYANNTKYNFTLHGNGWRDRREICDKPNRKVVVKVSGSDPGYRSTAAAFVLCAITILKEIDKMPKGGVLTPGAAFNNTSIVQKLDQHGMSFVVKDEE